MNLRFTIDYSDMPYDGSSLDGTITMEYDADNYLSFTTDNKLFNTVNDDIKKKLEEELRIMIMSYAECRKHNKTPMITTME